MKKILPFLSLILCACTQPEVMQRGRTPSEPILSEKCADIQKYKVFQVMNDGALALGCETKYGIEICSDLVAYIPKKKGQIYYDDMIVEPADGQCITYNGVYRYPAKSGLNKTVPKLQFVTE